MSGNRSKSAFFEGGEGASPTNHSWYQSSSVIALSCDKKNICSASFSFVTMHVCDRQTDRLTDRRTVGQNYDSQDRPRICSRGDKTWLILGAGMGMGMNEPLGTGRTGAEKDIPADL